MMTFYLPVELELKYVDLPVGYEYSGMCFPNNILHTTN